MSSTLIELARQGHEELETGIGDIVKLLSTETKTYKQKLMQQHKVLRKVQQMQRVAKKLKQENEDADDAKKQEIESMSGSDVFQGFYTRMRELREYHRKFPNLYYEPELPEQETTLADDPEILGQFTSEEMFGRFLDLNTLHTKFINLKEAKAVSYEQFLNIFLNFKDVPKNVKSQKAYKDYLEALKEYLLAFMAKAQPLVDAKTVLENAAEQAEEAFQEEDEDDDGPSEFLDRGIDILDYQSAQALEALGLEPLKAELQKLGLKCGGNLQQRAERLWATREFDRLSQIPEKFLAGGKAANDGGKKKELKKNVAILEAQIVEFGDLLSEHIEATKLQIQKKQSRTQEELAAEMENEMGDDEPESEESDDEGEKPIYNPKKVPLDWTGKPIPYWLYKLHGLNIEYKCEICGNFSYWGPRAFERHFQEWRHAHGMRCLKIPNTRAFHNITKIQDALDLMERLKSQKNQAEFDSQSQEEFEDAMGNVLSKKTYQDLLRQGLL